MYISQWSKVREYSEVMSTLWSWLVVLVGAVVVKVGGLWVEVVGPIGVPDRRPGCHYNNVLYPPGEVKISDCVTCFCAEYTGQMSCSVDTCSTHPDCIKYERVPGTCCPDCVETGCFYNQTGYPRGAKIPTGPCEVCYCPWEGGRGGAPVCGHILCQPTPCVDAHIPQGKCCSACPHGKCILPFSALKKYYAPVSQAIWCYMTFVSW